MHRKRVPTWDELRHRRDVLAARASGHKCALPNPSRVRSQDPREVILARYVGLGRGYGMVCAYCGVPLNLETVTLDHVVPKSRGGSNGAFNLVPSCRGCNNLKADRCPFRDGIRFRSGLRGWLPRIWDDRKIWNIADFNEKFPALPYAVCLKSSARSPRRCREMVRDYVAFASSRRRPMAGGVA